MPSPLLVTTPLAGPLTMLTLVGSRFPFTSVSLAATSTVTGVSSVVVALSSLATGGSFTLSTVTALLSTPTLDWLSVALALTVCGPSLRVVVSQVSS